MGFLRLEKLHKYFWQGSSRVDVLVDLNFEFQLNQSYAIVGASGSGKSTLIQILAGVQQSTMGGVNWNDEFELSQLSTTKRSLYWNQTVALIFQQPNLIDELTVLENVALKGLIAQNSQAGELAQELLIELGLGHRLNFFPAQLSKGEQQRVAIARAMMQKPKLILADEPTAALDQKTGTAVIEQLLNLTKEQQIGLIVCSHDDYVTKKMTTTLNLLAGALKSS